MNEQEKVAAAEKILETLERQAFANFYYGAFERYIGGEKGFNKETILNDIIRLFGIK